MKTMPALIRFAALFIALFLAGGCSQSGSIDTQEKELRRENDRAVQRQLEENGLGVTIYEHDLSESPTSREKQIASQEKIILLLESDLNNNRLKLAELEAQAEPDDKLLNYYRQTVAEQEKRLRREQNALSRLQGTQSIFDPTYNRRDNWFDRRSNAPLDDHE